MGKKKKQTKGKRVESWEVYEGMERRDLEEGKKDRGGEGSWNESWVKPKPQHLPVGMGGKNSSLNQQERGGGGGF